MYGLLSFMTTLLVHISLDSRPDSVAPCARAGPTPARRGLAGGRGARRAPRTRYLEVEQKLEARVVGDGVEPRRLGRRRAAVRRRARLAGHRGVQERASVEKLAQRVHERTRAAHFGSEKLRFRELVPVAVPASAEERGVALEVPRVVVQLVVHVVHRGHEQRAAAGLDRVPRKVRSDDAAAAAAVAPSRPRRL